MVAVSRRHPCDRTESRSPSGPLAARGPLAGLAAGGAEMGMRRRVAPAARSRPVVPVGPTAGGAALYSAVQLRRGPRTARGPDCLNPYIACRKDALVYQM